VEAIAVVIASFAALFVSSIAGYGGSLVLVPALAAILGPREGIALAALLLACNNVFKVIAYRRTLALRQGWPLVVVAAIGVLVGGRILLVLPEAWLVGGIIAMVVASVVLEVAGERLTSAKRRSSVPLMASSAVLSGASGSSGPLKGMAVRHLRLPRLEHVGLASCISLTGDALKANLFADAGLLPEMSPWVVLAALPMMPVAAWTGLHVNQRISEGAFRWVFWGVVGGYSLRLAGLWF
jgi:uncharacterized membrane protein YfcA